MIGGMFLCFEGWHKLADTLGLHPKIDAGTQSEILKGSSENLSSIELENQRVRSAIRTDFILSAEIMAITLSTISTLPAWMQGVVLALSGLAMTFIVYATVAIIVKADDFGAYLALQSSGFIRTLGKLIVLGMPIFLQLLSHVGMIAMLWVGGGIITHGLHVLGVHSPEDWINKSGDAVTLYVGNFGSWIVKAGIAAVLGLIVGAIVDIVSKKILLPLLALLPTTPP
jgi:predicted DNA repair protein MutK